MLPFPWQIGLLGVVLVLLTGFFLGLSLGTLFSAALRPKRRYVLDGIAEMIGFLGGSWLSAGSRNFAVELNGAVVAWQAEACWPHLRMLAIEHGLIAAIISCMVCIALGRVLASATAQVRALQAGKDAKA
jgi:hypothetical protein